MCVCLITGLEWVTPERSMAHLCVCVCGEEGEGEVGGG